MEYFFHVVSNRLFPPRHGFVFAMPAQLFLTTVYLWSCYCSRVRLKTTYFKWHSGKWKIHSFYIRLNLRLPQSSSKAWICFCDAGSTFSDHCLSMEFIVLKSLSIIVSKEPASKEISFIDMNEYMLFSTHWSESVLFLKLTEGENPPVYKFDGQLKCHRNALHH